MKKQPAILWVSFWLFAGCAALGQVEVAVSLEHVACLQFEPVHAIVTVRNETPRPLRFCGEETPGCFDLSFLIERRRMEWQPKTREGSMLSGVTIAPEETRRLAVEVTRWYSLAEMGRYMIRAVLRQGDTTYVSPQVMIDIVRGLELASVSRFVPGYESLNRTYALRYWRRGQHEYLFLTVDEAPTDMNCGVFELGRLLRVTSPTLTVDAKGNVTVRHQSSSDCFVTTTLKSEASGVRLSDQEYRLPDGSPYPFVELKPGLSKPKSKP